MRKIPETLTSGTTHEERMKMLRHDFQDRVGQYSAEPWCITEVEASDLLDRYEVVEILPALTKTGNEVKKLKNRDLIFLTQDEVLELLDKHLKGARLRLEGEKESARLRREQKDQAWLQRRAISVI